MAETAFIVTSRPARLGLDARSGRPTPPKSDV